MRGEDVNMKLVNASFEVLTVVDGMEIICGIERYCRTCYKSEDRITDESALPFVRGIMKRRHEAAIEHFVISVKVICDRGVSHEIVRHRLASYLQESTRFCNYGKGEEGVTFVKPCFWPENSIAYRAWLEHMVQCESVYLQMIQHDVAPQQARSVLPNSLKTEIVMTMNLREWRYFFRLRAAGEAGTPHPQMLEITVPMLVRFKEMIPVIFEDIVAVSEG